MLAISFVASITSVSRTCSSGSASIIDVAIIASPCVIRTSIRPLHAPESTHHPATCASSIHSECADTARRISTPSIWLQKSEFACSICTSVTVALVESIAAKQPQVRIVRSEECALAVHRPFSITLELTPTPGIPNLPAQAVIWSSASSFRIVTRDPLTRIHSSRRNWLSSRVTVSRDVPAILASSS